MSLEIPNDVWRDYSDRKDRSYLLCTMTVNGVDFHVTAIEVNAPDEQYVYTQEAVNDDHAFELNNLWLLAEPGEPFETVEIEGKHYVVYMAPFTR